MDELRTSTDLADLTNELATMFRPAVERAGLELVVECPPLPEHVEVDRACWAKVVVHLLSTALKFTFHGRIRMSLRHAGDHVELCVRDTGGGIPSDDLPRVLERFDLARLAGATIAVESELGTGTLFTVSMPIVRAQATAEIPMIVQFTTLLGHDLRNPLNAIATAAQLLERRATTPEIARPARRIVLSADRMTRMIGQLLDLARVHAAGGMRLEPKTIDLGELCQLVVAELRQANPDAQVELDTFGSLMGQWDSARLAQVLANVAGNAVDHGEPHAPVRVSLDGSQDSRVEIRVKNRGVIPDDALATLFDPFHGAKQTREHARGLGLGLYITREIVAAHRGRIDVKSSREDGTCFAIELPKRAGV